MQISVRGGAAERVVADALVLGIFEGTQRPQGAAQAVDKAAGGAIRDVIKSGDFTGKAEDYLQRLLVADPSPK